MSRAGGRRSSGRIKRRPSKKKAVIKNGWVIDPSISKVDLRDQPSYEKGYTAGTTEERQQKILARRDAVLDRVKGSGGIRLPNRRPKFARKSARAKLFDARRSGRPREHYYYFIEFEFSILHEWDIDSPDMNLDAATIKKLGTYREKLKVISVDNYSVLSRYFLRARVGSRASWTPRPKPTGVDGMYIRQTYGSYKKYGVDKKQLRRLIRDAEDRMAGYAVVTGIKGVWRSVHSEEYQERAIVKRYERESKKMKQSNRKGERYKQKQIKKGKKFD